MNVLEFSGVVGAGALVAGFLGALTGLGGGVVIVPLLTLALGVDVRYAIGASLVSVIATSSGAASAYVKEGYSNIRVGMFLEVAESIGALLGAFLASIISVQVIGLIFGIVLLHAAYHSTRPRVEQPCDESTPKDRMATFLRMHGTYPAPEGERRYCVRAIPLGFGLMFGAGTLSGLLGIGSGALAAA